MFAYVDPNIRAELVRTGKLWCINEQGILCSEGKKQGAPYITLLGPVPLPVGTSDGHCPFDWYAWVRNSDLEGIEAAVQAVRIQGPQELFCLLTQHMAVNSLLLLGDFAAAKAPLVRVHSNCLTGDVFGSLRCDCGPQLHAATDTIQRQGVGAIVYLASHEGRGIGLWAKAITYLLQDAGHDTYQANERLGLPADSRDFSDAARVLRHFRGDGRRIRLLGNNPLKREHLQAQGIEVVEQVPLVAGVSRYNRRYLTSKRAHGHIIPDGAIDSGASAEQEP